MTDYRGNQFYRKENRASRENGGGFENFVNFF